MSLRLSFAALSLSLLAAPLSAQQIAVADFPAEVRGQMGGGMGMIGGLAWPGCLRKLDRELPGYAD